MTPTSVSGPEPIADDVRIATLHLRLGQLLLARAELEDLLGRDALDSHGLAALAEARWRTGDGEAATAAAEAHLEGGGTDPIAICIAAEAAAASGRPGDARVLMDRLPIADPTALDALFAGMPRRAFWPAGPADGSDVDEIRRDADGRGGTGRGQGPHDARSYAGGRVERGAEPGARAAAGTGTRGEAFATGTPARALPGPRDVLEASGAWADIAAQVAAAGLAHAVRPARPGERRKAQLDPRLELERAREELGSRPERAFLRMALVIRADPTLAPAVLEAVQRRPEPAAVMLRGDAQRLLGRHLEAEASFDTLAETLES